MIRGKWNQPCRKKITHETKNRINVLRMWYKDKKNILEQYARALQNIGRTVNSNIYWIYCDTSGHYLLKIPDKAHHMRADIPQEQKNK